MITIDGATGSRYVQAEAPLIAESEDGLTLNLVVQLAGRAAEEAVIGSALAGSGNGEHSDLARATDLAAHMELAFGYGRTWPLLHRPAADRSSLLSYHPEIAERVHVRLEAAYSGALELMEANRESLEAIAEALLVSETLEGDELDALIATIKPQLVLPDEEPST
ncbi:hypothetical protein [Chelativorans sp. YIM 93263]|uniref:hypothetical protein n=1 Tax=Chelativorans sp. YIM 93263 TaxID=2906648 RepID=UPI002378F522|nr:hypothetical protein [Chelativorans sp. YIM 93263]